MNIPEILSSFKPWNDYVTDIERAGNRLQQVKLEWHLNVGPKADITLFALASVAIWVSDEQRSKSNEVVFLRPDMQAVLAYKPNANIPDTEILMVREFRAANRHGYVLELPMGSSFKALAPVEIALAELREESSLNLGVERLSYIARRQMVGPLATHTTGLYAAELTDSELEKLKQLRGSLGNEGDSERTWIEIVRLGDLSTDDRLDWANLGMIYSYFFGSKPMVY